MTKHAVFLLHRSGLETNLVIKRGLVDAAHHIDAAHETIDALRRENCDLARERDALRGLLRRLSAYDCLCSPGIKCLYCRANAVLTSTTTENNETTEKGR